MRAGARLLEWCGAETEPSQPRELGVIGPLCDETVHVMYVLMSYGYRYCCHARGCFKRQQFNILYISIPALLHEQVESKVVHFGRHGKHAPEVSGNGCIRDMNLRLRQVTLVCLTRETSQCCCKSTTSDGSSRLKSYPNNQDNSSNKT